MGSLVDTRVSGMDIGMMVAVGGMGEAVPSDTIVSIGEITVGAGAHEVKIRAVSKTVVMFLTFITTFFCDELPNGLRYRRLG